MIIIENMTIHGLGIASFFFMLNGSTVIYTFANLLFFL